jgi:hypothetical protein
MKGVMKLPEAMLHPVQANLHELKVVPGGMLKIVADNLEVFPTHGIDLVQQPGFIVSPEIFHIDEILSDQRSKFAFHARREGIFVALRIRSQEAADADATYTAWRIRRGNSNNVGALAGGGCHVPQSGCTNGVRRDETQIVIGVVSSIAKSVNTQ